MKTSDIKNILTTEGFTSLNGLEFIRELPNALQKIGFAKSSLDSSFYISAYISIDSDVEKLELGGSLCGGAIDYLESSFTDSSADSIKSILDTVLNPWFNALYSEYCSDECKVTDKNKCQNKKYNLIKTSEQLLSTLPQANNFLEAIGFNISRTSFGGATRFSRKIDDIYHIIELEPVSQGVFLAARVHVWMPELQVFEEYSIDSIPAHFETLTNVNGGFIHNKGNIDPRPVIPLDISSIESGKNVDSVLTECIKTADVDFLALIQNRIDLLNSVDPSYKRSSYFSHLFDKNSSNGGP